jgi:hypothetical protein
MSFKYSSKFAQPKRLEEECFTPTHILKTKLEKDFENATGSSIEKTKSSKFGNLEWRSKVNLDLSEFSDSYTSSASKSPTAEAEVSWSKPTYIGMSSGNTSDDNSSATSTITETKFDLFDATSSYGKNETYLSSPSKFDSRNRTDDKEDFVDRLDSFRSIVDTALKSQKERFVIPTHSFDASL